MVQKDIFHLYGGGPLDIPAVDKGKDGDAEDREQFDHLEIKDLVNVILISRLIKFINSLTTLRFMIQILRYSYFQSYDMRILTTSSGGEHSGKNGLRA